MKIRNKLEIKNTQNSKQYDLEDRTLEFARAVRQFTKLLPNCIQNQEDIRQLIRSSGSIGANYREANDSISKKDFLHRIRIARKEAKETEYWLLLIDCANQISFDETRQRLHQEARELMMILGAILRNSNSRV